VLLNDDDLISLIRRALRVSRDVMGAQQRFRQFENKLRGFLKKLNIGDGAAADRIASIVA